MNKTYFEMLSAYGEQRLTSVTCLDGSHAGEKALFCGGRQIYPEAAGEELGFAEELSGIVDSPKGRLFVEQIGRPPVCVICGAGHVGIPVIKLAGLAGFEVTVVEDRPQFADQARSAGADHVLCDAFANALAQILGGQQVYFVVMTRGHRYDEECLGEILNKSYAYVGMMSSRGRAARMRQRLLERGFAPEVIDGVHMPIGLSIHARTPQEIGISILAEMIEVKNGMDTGAVYEQELVESILQKETEEAWMLATIIRRRGSAPREVGAKMLLTDTGRTVGSIGGGCMEAEVIQKGLRFLRACQETGRKTVEIVTVDLSNAEAEEEGMVCGGQIEVLLEVVN